MPVPRLRLRAEEKLLQLKVEAAAAAENKGLAKLAAKWKESGPSKFPPLPAMKVLVWLRPDSFPRQARADHVNSTGAEAW